MRGTRAVGSAVRRTAQCAALAAFAVVSPVYAAADPAPTATIAAQAPSPAPASSSASPAAGPATAPGPATASGPATVPPPAAAATRQGLAVVAFPGATDAAWPLAIGLYGDRALRARSVDEASARVLCGDPAPPDAPAALRDLAQTVAALRSDDAPSRVLLAEIAHRFSVRALVAVWMDAGAHPTAHVFLPESGTFDAALYSPDSPDPATAAASSASWSGAVQSLDRVYAPGAAPVSVNVPPPLATHEVPQERSRSHGQFYESPWFWGGLGAAAAAAAAIYLSTRDTSSPTIHLELQVPK
jgi:hypothetical protein